VIDRLLLFGATGDLAGRFLFPALAELCAVGELPHTFEIVGAAREAMSDDAFRNVVAENLRRHGSDIARSARDALLRRIRYSHVDLASDGSASSLRPLIGDTGRALAAYLALPPQMFVTAVAALGEVGLPRGSRIVLEKPFGEDLDAAIALNQLLREVTGSAGEDAVFRVDHVLGMATVHNLLGIRLANRVLEPIWNSTHIERIDIRWEETLALENRAGYYDKAGALKDVMQNHMLQILALTAMELPSSLLRDLPGRKVDVLRTVCPPEPRKMAARTRRARYTAGRLAATGGASGDLVPNYVDEEGVDPSRCTETFAMVSLRLDSWRWGGTRFVLRAGKALHRRWKGVVVRFRPVPHLAFGNDVHAPPPNELRIGLDGPESLTLRLSGSAPGPPLQLSSLALRTKLPAVELRAYSQVLLDILNGDSTLSIRGDEAEEAWRIMTPVLRAWSTNQVPLEAYAAGSAGPRRR
jgi:glucose-6-phosphate 1-dehydrogenase